MSISSCLSCHQVLNAPQANIDIVETEDLMSICHSPYMKTQHPFLFTCKRTVHCSFDKGKRLVQGKLYVKWSRLQPGLTPPESARKKMAKIMPRRSGTGIWKQPVSSQPLPTSQYCAEMPRTCFRCPDPRSFPSTWSPEHSFYLVIYLLPVPISTNPLADTRWLRIL